ncbi:MAG: PilW family protein [Planctomycetota bacterium]
MARVPHRDEAQPRRRAPARCGRVGLTMVEIAVSLALFSVLMVTILEALSSTRMFVSSKSMRSDLAIEAQDVLDALVSDLGNSAWFISPIDATGSDTNYEKLAVEPDYDRERAVYFPYVFRQDASSLPSTNAFHDGYERYSSGNVVGASTMDPDHWERLPASHKEPSDEVVFLKVRKALPTPVPEPEVTDWVNFNQPATKMDQYANVSALSVVEGLNLQSQDGVTVTDVPLDWETYPGADPWGSFPLKGADYRELREYSYRLVPDEGNNRARFERCYRNGASDTVHVDQVLSTSVDRLQVDTYRTDAALQVNQVRFTLYMSKRPTSESGGVRAMHKVSVTVALRSTVDPEYALNLETWLGEAGHF